MDDDFDCGKYCEERLRTMEGSSLLDYLTDPTTATEPLQSSAYSGERSGPHPYNEPHPKKLRLDMRYQLCTEGELESLSTGFKPHNTNKSTKWSIANFNTGLYII